jgi:glycosyl transferase family 4
MSMIAMEEKTGAPRVLVISFSHLGTDPRVHRQLELLARHLTVTAVGWGPPAVPGVEFVPVPAYHWTPAEKLAAALKLKAGLFEAAYWSSASVRAATAALADRRFDLIVANDIAALPLAAKVRGGARILFDAHEYAPLEFEESWRWRFFFQRHNEYLCRRYVPLADAATTVCAGIAEEYRRRFGVAMTVVHNAPPFQELRPTASVEGPIRLVHHGGAIPSRQLEVMIETMQRLDGRFTLDFVLVPSVPGYLERLKALASGNGGIRFLPPVPMQTLPRFLNAYDAGIYLLPPSNFNNRYSLPNKFFEFVQARLAIVIGPSPEMAAQVRRHGMGIVSESFEPADFARALAGLDRERIARFKDRAHAAARELCYERAAEGFMRLIDDTLALKCAG